MRLLLSNLPGRNLQLLVNYKMRKPAPLDEQFHLPALGKHPDTTARINHNPHMLKHPH